MCSSHRLLRCVTITELYLLTALRGHNFRYRLQNPDWIGMAEIRKKWGSDRLRGPIWGVVNGFLSLSNFQTRAEALKRGKGGAGKRFGHFCRIIQTKSNTAGETANAKI